MHIWCVCTYLSTVSLGIDTSGCPVFLKDIWPTRAELHEVERQYVVPAMFKDTYSKITEVSEGEWKKRE